jgi:hypothetical protein
MDEKRELIKKSQGKVNLFFMFLSCGTGESVLY